MKNLVKNIVRLIQLNPNAVWKRKDNKLSIGDVCIENKPYTLNAFEAVLYSGYLRWIGNHNGDHNGERYYEVVVIPRKQDVPSILKLL